jgi:hypothetical protein
MNIEINYDDCVLTATEIWRHEPMTDWHWQWAVKLYDLYLNWYFSYATCCVRLSVSLVN